MILFLLSVCSLFFLIQFCLNFLFKSSRKLLCALIFSLFSLFHVMLPGDVSAQNAGYPHKLAIYYGYPSAVNQTNDVNDAFNVFNDYDLIIFADPLQFPQPTEGGGPGEVDFYSCEQNRHPDHYNTQQIIGLLTGAGKQVFGYVSLGGPLTNRMCEINGNSVRTPLPFEDPAPINPADPLSVRGDIVSRVDRWKDMGVSGIFLDEAGYDFGTSRDRQNQVIDYIHDDKDLPVFLNAWNPDDLFSSDVVPLNPAGEPSHVQTRDICLLESYTVIQGNYQSADFWQDRADKALYYRQQFGTQVATVTTTSNSTCDPDSFFLADQAQFQYAWWATYLYGFDYMGWGEGKDFSASGKCDGTLPFRPRPEPAGSGEAVSPITVGHDLDQHLRTTTTGSIIINSENHTGLFNPGFPPIGPSPCTIQPCGLLAWWPGNGNAVDIVNGHDGTLSPTKSWFVDGKVGQALSFDGLNDVIPFGNGPVVTGTGGFAIEGWIKTNSDGIILQQRDGTPLGYDGQYILSVGGLEAFVQDPGKVCWSTFGDGLHGFNFSSNVRVDDGVFHHIAVVREDDGTGRIYIDGVLDQSQMAPSRNLNPHDVFMGADPRNVDQRFFTGLIDELSLYDRTLFADEIQSIFDAGAGGKCTEFPPQKSVWMYGFAELDITETISQLTDKEINQVFLSINAKKLPAGDTPAPAYYNKLKDFISQARSACIRVHAMTLQDPSFTLTENHSRAVNFCEWIINFCENNQPDEVFDGIHIDTEPHTLTEWKNTENWGIKDNLMGQFEELLETLKTTIQGSLVPLDFSAAVAWWYNEKADEGLLPLGAAANLGAHLDFLVPMAYGSDDVSTIIDRVDDEVSAVPTLVGIKDDDFASEADLNTAISMINSFFVEQANYSGVSIFKFRHETILPGSYSGGLLSNDAVLAANSYNILSSIIVPPRVKLTIESDAILNFTEYQQGIEVYGRLVANAATFKMLNEPTSDPPVFSEHWAGIIFREGSTGELTNCTINNAASCARYRDKNFVRSGDDWEIFDNYDPNNPETWIDAAAHVVTLSDDVFINGGSMSGYYGHGVWCKGSGPTINNVNINKRANTIHNVYGIYCTEAGANPIISDCTIRESYCGIRLDEKASATIQGPCVIENNLNGIIAWGASGFSILDATISNNAGAGISWWADETVENRELVITNSTVANNQMGIQISGGSSAVINGSDVLSHGTENPNYGILVEEGSSAQINNSNINNNYVGIGVFGESVLAADGCTISFNTGRNGIELWDKSSGAITNCMVNNNAKYPVQLYSNLQNGPRGTLTDLSQTQFIDNETNKIGMGQWMPFQQSTIPNATIPYEAMTDIIIPPGYTLTVEPGAVIHFPSNYHALEVYGTLNASGATFTTPHEPTSDPPQWSEFWTGMIFWPNSTGNLLNCNIYNGASLSRHHVKAPQWLTNHWEVNDSYDDSNPATWVEAAAEVVTFSDDVVITGGKIAGGYGYGGIWCKGSKPQISNVAIEKQDNTIHNVWGIYCTEETAHPTITNCTIKYSQAGIRLETGAKAWVKEGCTITNNLYGISCIDASHLKIEESTISNNTERSGIELWDGSTAEITGCTIKDNPLYPIQLYTNQPGGFCGMLKTLADNSFNDGDYIAIGGRVPLSEEENHLLADGIPYYAFDNIVIDAGKTLICNPGVIVKFNRKGISVHGTMAANNATFTTFRQLTDPNKNWRALYFWPGSIGNIKNCIIEYGANGQFVQHVNGSDEYLQAEGNIVISGTDNVTLDNNITRHAGNYGIWINDCSPIVQATKVEYNFAGAWITSGSAPTLVGCEFVFNNWTGVSLKDASPHFNSCIIANNTLSGLYSDNSAPSFSVTRVENNGSYGVYLTGTAVPSDLTGIQVMSGHTEFGVWNTTETPVAANDVFWGHETGPYHEVNYPGGSGDIVSDFVTVDNFRTQAPTLFLPYADMDFDGLSDNIDVNPGQVSFEFSDGDTYGSIEDAGDQELIVVDAADENVGVIVVASHSGGPTPASISHCGDDALVSIEASVEEVVTCGSVNIDVELGEIKVAYTAYDGSVANTVIEENNSVDFDPEEFTFEVPENNTEDIILEIEGTEIALEPGEVEEIVPYSENEFVLLAVNSIKIKKDTKILSGDIIVNDISDDVELTIEKNVTTPLESEIKANRIKLKKDVTINGDIYSNELDSKGIINGAVNTPLELPVFSFFPKFNDGKVGFEDINVNKNQSLTLDNGDYNKISVDKNGKIVFSGSVYNVASFHLKEDCKLLFSSPTEIRVLDNLECAKNVFIGPSDESEISASDIIFYVNGQDPKKENVKIEKDNTIYANIYLKNGRLRIHEGTIARGAFIADEIILEKEITLLRDSYFRSQDQTLAKTLITVLTEEIEKETQPLPEFYSLEQNYPNPFNPETEISFQIPKNCKVDLKIFNALGKEIRTLANSYYPAGSHSVRWDAKDNYGNSVSSGVYLYQLRAGDFVATKKMNLLR